MQKLIWFIVIPLFLLTACGEDDELHFLEVDFDVPETAEVKETVELKATVTYGDEKVTDADEVVFEVWERGNRDDGEMIDGEHQGDGVYTTELTFDHDGIFEMYAHTTAKDMHTMPKKEIIIGEGGDYDDVDEETVFHTEGFDLEFVELDEPTTNEAYELTVYITIHDEALENAEVRYEIWNDETEDDRDWVDAEEVVAGEYRGTYTFEEESKYYVQVHVEDDEDLHEHAQYEIEVEE